MEFRDKLQDLRKSRKLTQERLADAINISRAAVSKWESGRGFPNIEALKNLARVFEVSVDELLSGDELIEAAERDNRNLRERMLGFIFGVFDALSLAFFFLPFFGERVGNFIHAVNWFQRTWDTWNGAAYALVFISMGVVGLVEIAMHAVDDARLRRAARIVSLSMHSVVVLLFCAAREPYFSAFLFLLLLAKMLLLLRKD